jgi:hypothetical protein
MDLNPNTTFDYGTCPPSTLPHQCDIDYVDTHAPLGSVLFSIFDKSDKTDPPVAKETRPCVLGHGSATPAVVTPAPALSHLLPHPIGQIDYASWCSVNYTFPIGSWRVVANYNTPTTPHVTAFAAKDMNVDVN